MSLPKPSCGTPHETEDAFYHAILLGDLATLMGIWADEENIVCVLASGVRLRGPNAIRCGFKTLFDANPSGILVEKSSLNIFSKPTLAVHSVIEELTFPESGQHISVVATNTYLRYHDGWRIVAYHGSVSAPANQTLTSDFLAVLH